MIWWLTVSWFTHVTVVPFGTVILSGENAKFWIVTVGPAVSCIGVVVGVADIVGTELVHPHRAMEVPRTRIRIIQWTGFGVHLIQITLIRALAGEE